MYGYIQQDNIIKQLSPADRILSSTPLPPMASGRDLTALVYNYRMKIYKEEKERKRKKGGGGYLQKEFVIQYTPGSAIRQFFVLFLFLFFI